MLSRSFFLNSCRVRIILVYISVGFWRNYKLVLKCVWKRIGFRMNCFDKEESCRIYVIGRRRIVMLLRLE